MQAGRAGPENASSSIPPVKPSAPLGHVKRFFFGDKLDKERMKQLGMGAVASYGFVSNVTYGGGEHSAHACRSPVLCAIPNQQPS